ncbi:hypothetical protein Q1695_004218 [Nippostrongylus brasiliensis]|nr:hypothetical protein Q1695_004218 [Nippostrongylus brasiliensis]
MLLIAVSVALLVASCASQNGIQDFGVSLSAECRRNENDRKFLLVRETFLDRFNHLRQRIAKGENVDGLNTTGPKLMYGTRYSCRLEDIASKLLNNGQTQHPTYLVFNYTSTRNGPPITQVKDATEKMKTIAPATLLSPHVPFFGCALEEKQLRMTLLCIFYNESSAASSAHRAPCTEDSDCLLNGRTTLLTAMNFAFGQSFSRAQFHYVT